MSVAQFGVIASLVAVWALVGFVLGWTLKPTLPVPPPRLVVVHAPPKAPIVREHVEEMLQTYTRGRQSGIQFATNRIMAALHEERLKWQSR